MFEVCEKNWAGWEVPGSRVRGARDMNSHSIPQIIDGKILCVHGGLSPDIRLLDQVWKFGLASV
jgi:diadenosine tetraphosphatase ApaH/serine/threonine PP2A family protein phosphatase